MNNKRRTLENSYKDIVLVSGDPCTHFLYDLVNQQQHKSRDSNAYLSNGSQKDTKEERSSKCSYNNLIIFLGW